MPDWFDDFMDHKLSQSEGTGKPTGCLAWILGAIALWVWITS